MSRIRRWNGSQWTETTGLAQRWSGSRFDNATVQRWSGSRWETISQQEYTTTYNAIWTASFNGSGAYTTTTRQARWGDTVSHYALWYNTTISNIVNWNSPIIPNPHLIYEGTTYTIRRTAMSRRRNTNNLMYQGQRSVGRLANNHGRESAMIGFNSALIRNDLAGAEILRCEVYIRCHQPAGNRVRAVYGYHNQASAPATFSENQYWAQSEWFNGGEGKWVTIPNSLGQRLRDGQVRGITLNANSSTDQGYVGSFHGRDNSNPPRLRITYRK